MIRYLYTTAFTPPAPCVHIVLRDVANATATSELPALLDSGADRSVIPRAVVDELRLIPLREITVAGLGGEIQKLETFAATIQIRNLQPLTIEVLAHEDEPVVLLGRDVLNHLRVVLDGPNQVLEIT